MHHRDQSMYKKQKYEVYITQAARDRHLLPRSLLYVRAIDVTSVFNCYQNVTDEAALN